MALRVAVILNPKSGAAEEADLDSRIRRAFAAAGADAEIIPLTRDLDVSRVIRDRMATGVHSVVAAGGDGTVSAVASTLTGTDTPLGVLATGTLNHFARDLRLPLNVEEAAAVIAAGHTTRVDVAEVNGRIFVNNSSIGLYPAMVATREHLRSRGVPKWIAQAYASLTALMRFPNLTIRASSDSGAIRVRTPLVFIGNNEYEFTGLEAGTRSRLVAGSLQACYVKAASRSKLIRIALLTLLGKLDADLHASRAQVVEIRTMRRHIRVAVDGEILRLRSPLVYRIRPAALTVLTAVPAGTEDYSHENQQCVQ